MDKEELKDELLDRLGFCECGLPDDALELVHDMINYIDEPYYEGTGGNKEWLAYCEENKQTLRKIIDDNYDGVCYLIWYLLDDKGIIEHGTSVPGWILDEKFKNKLGEYIGFIRQEES